PGAFPLPLWLWRPWRSRCRPVLARAGMPGVGGVRAGTMRCSCAKWHSSGGGHGGVLAECDCRRSACQGGLGSVREAYPVPGEDDVVGQDVAEAPVELAVRGQAD